MIITKSLKIRIYPNKNQTIQIGKTLGCSRFIYNSMLAERKEVYEKYKNNREKLWTYKYKTEKDYKNEFEWLKEVDSISLQQSRMDLSNAYMNFFRSLKKQNKGDVGFPKFHKKGVKDSYRIALTNDNIKLDFINHKIKLPKLNWINYKDSRVLTNFKICSATVSKSKTNKYFVSILYEKEINDIVKKPITNKSISTGLDMSLDKFYVDDKGISPNYQKQDNLHKRISILQKRARNKKKTSNNFRKNQLKINKLYEKITNSRKDFIEKLSNKLIEENDMLIIESLNMKEIMTRKSREEKQKTKDYINHGKSGSNIAWGMFVNRLNQKIILTDKTLIKADKWFASSQLCHVCGYQNKSLTIRDREWDCPICGSHLMRDQNAGENLKKYGINILRHSRSERPEEPVEMSSEEESMKQEAFRSLV